MPVFVVLCLLFIVVSALPTTVNAGQWQKEEIASMPTQLYVPSTAPQLAGKRALMVSLGGCGQQAKGNTEFQQQSNWQQTADDYGLVLALPNAPDGGVLAYGCWDYYGVQHSRDNRHNDNLLALVSDLLQRKSLNIDSGQVYLSGLSSGGAMVNVLMCLAPDVFAGGGNAAGPALGTSALQTLQVATDTQSVTEACLALAGDNREFLDTQVMSVVWGNEDAIANPGYAEVIAQSFVNLYGADASNVANPITGIQFNAQETRWGDEQGPRVSLTMIHGLGHAWPAGGGSGTSAFMDNQSINYPALLARFLFANNRRVHNLDPSPSPVVMQPPAMRPNQRD